MHASTNPPSIVQPTRLTFFNACVFMLFFFWRALDRSLIPEAIATVSHTALKKRKKRKWSELFPRQFKFLQRAKSYYGLQAHFRFSGLLLSQHQSTWGFADNLLNSLHVRRCHLQLSRIGMPFLIFCQDFGLKPQAKKEFFSSRSSNSCKIRPAYFFPSRVMMKERAKARSSNTCVLSAWRLA